jgi:hypothetical protein
MILLAHIVIALSSIAYSTYLFFSPSKKKLYASYGLVGLTLVSGTYLVISTGAHVLQSCLTGLVYIGVVSTVIVGARYRLAKNED